MEASLNSTIGAPNITRTKYELIKYIEETHGYKLGADKREQAYDYKRVIDLDTQHQNLRLIVCKDAIQVILQENKGGRWRATDYYVSQSGFNRGLDRLMISRVPLEPIQQTPRRPHGFDFTNLTVVQEEEKETDALFS